MTNNLQRLLIKIYDGWLLCANQDVLKHLWALSYWPGTIAYFVKKSDYHEIVLVLALNRRPNISFASAVCSFLLSL